jgi:dihydrofolate reductase
MAKVLYHITMSLDGFYGGRVQVPIFVVTRDAPATEGFTLVEDLGEAVAAASEAAGEGYVAVLGPTTARQCLEAGLLDEVLVHVAPILLGDGVRLFDHPGGTRIRLDPLELSHAGSIGNFRYRVA